MKLLEVLEAIKTLNVEEESLTEAKKKASKSKKAKIKSKFNNKKAMALKIAKKLKPRKNSINWTDDVIEIRNKVVGAFMNNDADTVVNMMTSIDGYKTVEILKALETAHGGYKRLEAKAKDKKKFIQTVYAYIDDLESSEED